MQLEDLNLRAKLWNEVYREIGDFFAKRNYTEVRTPIAVTSPGMEPNLDPVEVIAKEVNGKEHLAGLITSPEYSMKKLLAAGMERIFTVTPVFRNLEKLGERWSVEFTMLEWYRQGEDYGECMKETEQLVNGIIGDNGTAVWPRISYVQEFEKHFGCRPEALPQADWRFQTEVMPGLLEKYERFFLMEYPISEASLARKTADGRAAERFEGYVKGIEICNGFTELVDPVEQRARFEIEAEERRAAGKRVFPIDEELISGLSSIASPTFGNALGVDRLVMLKAGVKDIDAVHLFPPSKRFKR